MAREMYRSVHPIFTIICSRVGLVGLVAFRCRRLGFDSRWGHGKRKCISLLLTSASEGTLSHTCRSSQPRALVARVSCN